MANPCSHSSECSPWALAACVVVRVARFNGEFPYAFSEPRFGSYFHSSIRRRRVMRSDRCAARRVLGSPSAEAGELSRATRSRSRSTEEPHAKTNVRETVGALRFLAPSGPMKPTNVRKTDP